MQKNTKMTVSLLPAVFLYKEIHAIAVTLKLKSSRGYGTIKSFKEKVVI